MDERTDDDLTDDDLTDGEPAARAVARLVQIMRTLRGPGGCPWDREQDMGSLRRYVLEEAHEVVDAIDAGDPGALRAELGDLLLQVVFLAQIAAESGAFDLTGVAATISDKLVRRHPHVFAEARADTAEQVVAAWEEIKHHERGGGSLLDDVPRALPGLARADKLGKRAAQLFFDWPGPAGVLAKLREEIAELEAAIAEGATEARLEEELGDALFAMASLGRHLRVSAELAVARAGAKFERRFRQLEEAVAAGSVAAEAGALEEEWRRIKSRE